MTYCVAASVSDGLVFVSDSRTNAGLDRLGTASKMHTFFGSGATDENDRPRQSSHDRFFVILSAGNLATTQAVMTALKRDIDSNSGDHLGNATSLEHAAECIGAANVAEQQKHTNSNPDFNPEASFIFGGQIRGNAPCVFLIYPEGNFVRASDEAPYLQIGETKYGKPILDRILTGESSLDDTLKCALLSMDSTLHSNATVGPPIEALVYRDGAFDGGNQFVLGESDAYLVALRDGWNQRMKEAFQALPNLDAAPATSTVTPFDR